MKSKILDTINRLTGPGSVSSKPFSTTGPIDSKLFRARPLGDSIHLQYSGPLTSPRWISRPVSTRASVLHFAVDVIRHLEHITLFSITADREFLSENFYVECFFHRELMIQ